MTSRTGMTESRWAYLKALRPGFGHYLHVSRGLIPVKGADGIVRLTPFLDFVLTWNTGISYGWFPQESDFGRFVRRNRTLETVYMSKNDR